MELKPKKIAVLCNYWLLPDRVGGMDYFFWYFDAHCKANGVSVDWFFPNLSAHGDYPKLHIIPADGQEVEVFFEKNQAKENYTHIITHFIELCTPFFKSVKQKSGAKLIAVDHNPRPINGYPFKKKLSKRVKGWLYSRYIDVFVGVSAYSKQQLIREFGSRIKNRTMVVFNGIDQDKYAQKTDFAFSGKFIVACHLRKDKGIQDLIGAVQEVLKHATFEFTVDIYGEGDYYPQLQELIDLNQLQAVFSFKGSVTNLHQLYAGYDYLIHPSHGETFCYSVVESLMSNLPVITTKNQGNVLGLVTEGQNGYLFEEQDKPQLQAILFGILTGTKAINMIGNNAKLNGLTLQRMAENHFNLLQ